MTYNVYYGKHLLGKAETPREAQGLANKHQGGDLPIRGWQREGENLRSEGGFYLIEPVTDRVSNAKRYPPPRKV